MELNLTKTIELSENDVKQAVVEFLNHKGYEIIEDFDFIIHKKRWTEGYGMAETDYEKLIFEGAKIKIG